MSIKLQKLEAKFEKFREEKRFLDEVSEYFTIYATATSKC
jgi:hypothetical protein